MRTKNLKNKMVGLVSPQIETNPICILADLLFVWPPKIKINFVAYLTLTYVSGPPSCATNMRSAPPSGATSIG